MTLEIILEEEFLKNHLRRAKKEYKEPLALQKESLDKYTTTKSEKIKQTILDANLLFAGTYTAIKSKLKEKKILSNNPFDKNINSQITSLASEAVIQYISKNYIVHSATSKKTNIAFSKPEYSFISSILGEVSKQVKKTISYKELPQEITSYFSSLKKQSLQEIQIPEDNLLETIKEITIKSKYFTIEGIKDSVKTDIQLEKNEEKEYSNKNTFKSKQARTINSSSKITYDMIKGNKEAKDAIKDSVEALMSYCPSKKLNPYLETGGFQQNTLLAGDSGSGKTMTAEFAISYAQEIANKYGLEITAKKLEFESTYVDGSITNLREQLREIESTNTPQIILFDDCENKFKNRSQVHLSDNSLDQVTEFLDFMNGVNYENKGNYIIIATANNPFMIDKAVRSRFAQSTHYCKGPINAEEKASVLQEHLKKGIQAGYVQVDSWDLIGEISKEYELTGRNLRDIANQVIKKSSISPKKDFFYTSSYEEKVGHIQKNHEMVDEKKIINEINSFYKSNIKGLEQANKAYLGEMSD